MQQKKSRLSRVEEARLGMYVWILPNGDTLMDDDLNVLNIPAMKGDLSKIVAITNAAKNMGFDGRAKFEPGRRRVTDWELDDQLTRMANGLVPDPLDIGVYKDATRGGY